MITVMKSCRLFFLIYFLLIASSGVEGKIPDQQDVDSLTQLLSFAKEDTQKVNILNQLAAVNISLGRLNGTSLQVLMALDLSEKLSFKKGKAYALKNLVVVKYYEEKYDTAIGLAKYNMILFEELGDIIGMYHCNNNLGLLYLSKGETDSSIHYYEKAISSAKYLEKGKRETALAKSYSGAGGSYKMRGDYKKALSVMIEGLQFAEKAADSAMIGVFLNNIAVMYKIQGDIKNALNYYNRSVTLNKKTSNYRSVSTNYANIASLYIAVDSLVKAEEFALLSEKEANDHGSKNDLASVYSLMAQIRNKQKKYAEAISFYKKAIDLSTQLNDFKTLSASLNNTGEIYLSVGDSTKSPADYKSAISYLERGLELTRKIGNTEWELVDLNLLAEGYAMINDYKKAYEYFREYKTLQDTVFSQQKTRDFMQLQTQFETEKKEKQIVILNKDKELQQKEAGKQRIIRNSFICGFAIVMLFAGIFFIQRNRISKEKNRSEALLLNILPYETARELKEKGSSDARQFDEVTVMFTDFKDFTLQTELLSATELVAEIDFCYKEFDRIIGEHNIEKIKTIGDSYMAAGGLPVMNNTNAIDVVKAGVKIQQFMADLKIKRTAEGKNCFEIRIGIHTGPVVAGIVGIKKFAYDIWGDTVNLASRMQSGGEAGKVNISGATFELVKKEFACTYRGKVEAKNKGSVDMYFVDT